MKKFATIVAALMLFTGASAETVSILCRPGETVNIREKPTTRSEVVGRYECGYTFETDGEVRRDKRGRKWVHMVNAQLEVGEAWVIATYVQQSKVTAQSVTAVVDAKGRVALRKAPNGDRIQWVKKGSQVNVLAYSADWAVTDQGYIAMDCLVFDGSEG